MQRYHNRAALILTVTLLGPFKATVGQEPPVPAPRILYFAARPGSLRSSIYGMNADGTQRVNLTQAATADNLGGPRRAEMDPAWSPDGGRIAFVKFTGLQQSEVFVMQADGTDRFQLTQLHTMAACPAWSPDGRHIAFGTFNLVPGGQGRVTTDLCVMDADGSHVRVLGDGFMPSWSPDGQHLLYSVVDKPGPLEFWIMNSDGTHARHFLPGACGMGAWSPDGLEIAYVAYAGDKRWHIFVMNADTSQQRQVSDTPKTTDSCPQWSPDGRQVFFVRETRAGAPAAVCVIGVDGQGFRQLSPPGTAAYLTGGVLSMMQGQVDESLANLRQLGAAVYAYAAQHDGAAPTLRSAPTLTPELLPFIDAADVLNQPDTGTPYRWNPLLSNQALENFVPATTIILAYEAAPTADRFRRVLFLDGHVERVPEAEWPLLKAESQLK